MYKQLLTLLIVLSFSSFINAQGYQRLDPVAVYTSESGQLYIVMEYNIGARGCTHDKNSILIHPEEHSSEFLKSSMSIALAAVAAKQSLKVFWDGCLTSGRPKATLIGFGSTEIN